MAEQTNMNVSTHDSILNTPEKTVKLTTKDALSPPTPEGEFRNVVMSGVRG
jgi:hypothetical protein